MQAEGSNHHGISLLWVVMAKDGGGLHNISYKVVKDATVASTNPSGLIKDPSEGF